MRMGVTNRLGRSFRCSNGHLPPHAAKDDGLGEVLHDQHLGQVRPEVPGLTPGGILTVTAYLSIRKMLARIR